MNIKTIVLISMLAISGSVNAALVQPDSYIFDVTPRCDNRCYYDSAAGRLTDGVYGQGSSQIQSGFGWVGWNLNSPSKYVNIDFSFSEAQTISEISINSIANYSGNHTEFSIFTMDSQGEWLLADISSSVWTDRILTISGDFSSTSKIRLKGSTPDGWILVGEVQFEASAVPIPAAAWLFGSGLLGLSGLKRRQ
jgi:hypothetical protein